MIPNVTVRDVKAFAAHRRTLNVRDLCRHFHIGFKQAEELLALAASGKPVEATTEPSAMEAKLMREHSFSRSEASAAQRMIISGEIKAHD